MVYSKEFLELKVPSEVQVLLFSIELLVAVALGIIFFGRIDDVIKVNGIVRTSENVSVLHNVISGKIVNKNYKPGQKVLQGDFLYELDSSVYDSQKNNLISEKENLETRLCGVDKLLESYRKNKNLVNKKDEVAWTRYESYKKNVEKLALQKELSYQALLDEKNLPESMRNKKTIRQKNLEYEYSCKSLESYQADFIKALNQEKEELDLSYFKVQQELIKLDNQ